MLYASMQDLTNVRRAYFDSTT